MSFAGAADMQQLLLESLQNGGSFLLPEGTRAAARLRPELRRCCRYDALLRCHDGRHHVWSFLCAVPSERSETWLDQPDVRCWARCEALAQR
ncbi:hypothetical protein D4764_20G0000040 [Takifugu flavidus]|uniref:Uncharacterized protein n=1 Tax=Takifugu flavidus TaxID=433684 RepID=A0A5C6NEP6_9TELE|nr:hypothetical protein D4764_20G0000040 [Takifugu flavidus]